MILIILNRGRGSRGEKKNQRGHEKDLSILKCSFLCHSNFQNMAECLLINLFSFCSFLTQTVCPKLIWIKYTGFSHLGVKVVESSTLNKFLHYLKIGIKSFDILLLFSLACP